MIVTQWQRTGRLNDIERQFLLSKIEELYEGVNYAATNNILLAEELDKEEDVVGVFTEFSVEVGMGDAEPVDSVNGFSVHEEPAPEEPQGFDNAPKGDADGTETLAQTRDAEVEAEPQPEYADNEPLTENTAPETVYEAPTVDERQEMAGEQSRRGKLDKRAIRALYEDDVDSNFGISAQAPDQQPGSALRQPAAGVEQVSTGQEQAATEAAHPGLHSADAVKQPQAHFWADEPHVSVDEAATGPAGTVSVTIEEKTVISGSFNPGTKRVLGDIINSDTRTFGDTVAQSQTDTNSRLAAEKITNLRKAIGVNDKYLMIHDIFRGEVETFENAISRLDEFDDLDDAMLWMHDNFEWDAQTQGARLLADMLVRKLM